jgi:superoxide dismutase, Fe-Mn family
MMSRREAVKEIAKVAAVTTAAASIVPAAAQPAAPAPAPAGPYTLPPLPYALDALEPVIDARTVEIHHGKHHATYVANLNKAVADHPELHKKTVDELLRDLTAIPESIRTAVRNHGGGHANHCFFWSVMARNGGGQPKGELAKAIDKKFGSFGGFQEQFTKAATTQFGSGWAWLTLDERRELRIEQSPNQDTPWSAGRRPLLTIDVWEHAYYLKYQNRRADFITAFYQLINWEALSENYRKFMTA